MDLPAGLATMMTMVDDCVVVVVVVMLQGKQGPGHTAAMMTAVDDEKGVVLTYR